MLRWTTTTPLLALLCLGSPPAGLLTPVPVAAGSLHLTHRVSVSSRGAQADGRSLEPISLSADGRFVAFTSEASNLVPGDTNGLDDVFYAADVFVHDRDADGDGVFDEPGAIATRRVSVSSRGAQADGSSYDSSLSADGRFVAFTSFATNLVPDDTNGRRVTDVFVHDRDADGDGVFDEPGAIATRRVSVSSRGAQGYAFSLHPSLSADGRFVAFDTSSSNLVPGDTNNTDDVFVHDRDTDGDGVFDEPGAIATVRVSVASSGTQGNNFSWTPSLSADGRFVAFLSVASNLVPGDTNGLDDFRKAADIFVHDRDADGDGVFDEPGAIATVRVSVASSGTQGNNSSWTPRLSADGRVVAFFSEATNLVSGDTNNHGDVFVHDRDADGDGVFDEPGAIATRRVSVSSRGAQANDGSGGPSLSADGRVVAFSSAASNLVPGDTNDSADVFVHDRDADGDGVFDEPGARATLRVSVSRRGAQGKPFSSSSPGLSADGGFVAFASYAGNLVPGDTNNEPDIFVHNRPRCGGKFVTHLGTPGPDVLMGTSGPDVLHGLGGNDLLRGGGGADRLCGGPGADTLVGHTGHDRLSGGDGADQLVGGDGNDALFGGMGDDALFGGDGDDRLYGRRGADTLDGGPGDDGCGEDALTTGESAVRCERVLPVP